MLRTLTYWLKHKMYRSPAVAAWRRPKRARLEVEVLETRLAPVIGSTSIPALVAPGGRFDGVVAVNTQGLASGTGALIAPGDGHYILTVEHNGPSIAGGGPGNFTTQAKSVTFNLVNPGSGVPVNITVPVAANPAAAPPANPATSFVINNPFAIGAGADDIALWKLTDPTAPGANAANPANNFLVAPFRAQQYALANATPAAGSPITFVGYGRSGVGATGATVQAFGKRVGMNTVDGTGVMLQNEVDLIQMPGPGSFRIGWRARNAITNIAQMNAGDPNEVRATTSMPHNYAVGDIVIVVGSGVATIDGAHVITAVAANTFDYVTTGLAAGVAPGAVAAQVTVASGNLVSPQLTRNSTAQDVLNALNAIVTPAGTTPIAGNVTVQAVPGFPGNWWVQFTNNLAGQAVPGIDVINAPPPATIMASAQAAGNPDMVTITTANPHGLVPGQRVVIANVQDAGNVALPGYNGTFTVTSVGAGANPTTFTYIAPALAAATNAAASGTVTLTTGELTGTSAFRIASVAQNNAGNRQQVTVTVPAATPINFGVGAQVVIEDVVAPGNVAAVAAAAAATAPYNNSGAGTPFFLVTAVDAANNTFTYVTAGLAAGANTPTAANRGTVRLISTPTVRMVRIGGDQRNSAEPTGGVGPVFTASNLAMDFDNGLPLNDANTLLYNAGQANVAPQNPVNHNITVTGTGGTYRLGFQPATGGSAPIQVAVQAGNPTPNRVTITTANPHPFSVGQQVNISFVTVGGYNGTFTITAVADPFHFTYETPAAVVGLGPAFGGLASQASAPMPSTNSALFTGALANNANAGQVLGALEGLAPLAPSLPATAPSSINGVIEVGNQVTVLTGMVAITNLVQAAPGAGNPLQVTVTTNQPHGFANGQQIVISGINSAATGAPMACYNGTFTITSLGGGPNPTTFTFDTVTPDGGATALGAAAAAANATGAVRINLAGIAGFAAPSNGNNRLVPGQMVTIAGVPAPAGPLAGTTGYNGTFQILSASPFAFTYLNPIGSLPPNLTIPNNFTATARPANAAITNVVNGANVDITTDGPHGLQNGQVVRLAGYANAAWNTTFVVTRLDANRFRFTPAAALPAPGALLSATVAALPGYRIINASAAAHATIAGATTITVNTPMVPNFLPGQSVTLSGLPVADYNGTFVVEGVNGNSFTCTKFAAIATFGANLLVNGAAASMAIGGNAANAGYPTTTVTGNNPFNITYAQSPGVNNLFGTNVNPIFVANNANVVGSTNLTGPGAGVAITGNTQVTNEAGYGPGDSGGPNFLGNTNTIVGVSQGGYANTQLPDIDNSKNGSFGESMIMANVASYTQGSTPIQAISQANAASAITTVTFANNITDFSPGQTIVIAGASVAGYNGTWKILTVNNNTLTFRASAAGLAPGAANTGTVSGWINGVIAANNSRDVVLNMNYQIVGQSVAAGSATISGVPIANPTALPLDDITISVTRTAPNGNLVIQVTDTTTPTLSGVYYNAPANSIQSLIIVGANNNTTFQIAPDIGMPVRVTGGAGNDTFIIGAAAGGNLGLVSHDITVNGGAGTNTFTVNDRAAIVGRTYDLDPGAGALNTLNWHPLGTPTFHFSNVGRVTLNAGNRGNVVNVGALNGARATINAGTGGDQINARANNLGLPIEANAAGATTVVSVGSVANSLNSISDSIIINGAAGTATTVNINDQGTAAAQIYTVINTRVTRTLGAIPIIYNARVTSIFLNTAAGSTTNVQSTNAPTTTSIIGAGNAVNIGNANTLQAVRGNVNVIGAGTLTVNDQAGAMGTTYVNNANQVAGAWIGGLTVNRPGGNPRIGQIGFVVLNTIFNQAPPPPPPAPPAPGGAAAGGVPLPGIFFVNANINDALINTNGPDDIVEFYLTGPLTHLVSILDDLGPAVAQFTLGTVASNLVAFLYATHVGVAGGTFDVVSSVTAQNVGVSSGNLTVTAAQTLTATGNANLTGGVTRVDAGGLFDVAGDFTQTSGDTLSVDLVYPDAPVQVAGAVSLAGILDLTVPSGFMPSTGMVITLIRNSGSASVNGHFVGLPEGTLVTVGNVKYAISYHGGASLRDVVLTVASGPPTDSIPVANYFTVPLELGQSAHIDLVAHGFDIDGNTLAAAVMDPPAHGDVVFNAATGLFDYTPAPLNYAGPDSFTYVVNDGVQNSNIATVAIMVNPGVPILTVTAAGGVYDGSAYTATVTVAGVIPGVDDTPGSSLEGIAPTLTYYGGTVGAGIPLAAAPTDAGTYTVATHFVGSAHYTHASAYATFTITPASLTVAGIGASNKIYDGFTDATINGTAELQGGVVSGDDVTLDGSAATAAFDDKNVGAAKTVTFNGYVLAGADADNYTLDQPAAATADITAASLSVGGVSGTDKVYDGLTDGLICGAASLLGLLAGDDVFLDDSAASASFADKNVGTAKAFTFTGYTISGADAGNYSFSQPAASTADITAIGLTISGGGGANKVYDGLADGAISGNATLQGMLAGDDVALNASSASASFDDANVGAGKTVTFTGYTLAGADAGNYNLAQPATSTADITPAQLTVTAAAQSKVYDGSTFATVTLAVGGALGSDVVSANYAAANFDDANVGVGKTVTVTGITLGGAASANYTANSTATTTADITPPGDPIVITVSNLANGQSVTLPYTVTGTTTGTVQSMTFQIDDGPVTSITVAPDGSFSIPLTTANTSSGQRILTITGYAPDNSATSTSITFDATAPPPSNPIVITVSNLANGQTVNLPYTVNGTTTGPVQSMAFQIDNGPVTSITVAPDGSFSIPLTTANTSSGPRMLSIFAFGDSSTTTASIAFTAAAPSNPQSTSISLAISDNTPDDGFFSLDATITNQTSAFKPGGTVQFWDGATLLGSGPVDAFGKCSILVSTDWTIGSHNVFAVYSGDANFDGSSSSGTTPTITEGPCTVQTGSGLALLLGNGKRLRVDPATGNLIIEVVTA